MIPALINVTGQIAWGMVGRFVEAGIIGFTIKLAFLFTILFGFIFIREERFLVRVPEFWLGSAGCIVGLILMYLQGLSRGGVSSFFGMLLLVFVTVCWGAYAVSIKKYLGRFNPMLAFGVISIYTSIPLILFMFIYGDSRSLLTMNPGMWFLIIISGLIGITFSHVFYYIGIGELGAIIANGILMLTPFVTLLGSFLLLGERAGSLEITGGLIILAGGVVLLAAWNRAGKAGLRG